MTKITFLGDIMFDYAMVLACNGNSVPIDNKCFNRTLSNLKPLLNESDYVIGNLETPISLDNTQLTYREYEFNTSINFAKALKDAGVDFVTTANNHMMDRGIDGLVSTYKSLESIGLKQSGINLDNKNRFSVIDINGMRIGILAYTYGTNAFSNHKFLSLKKREMKYINLLQEQEGSVNRIVSGIFGKGAANLYKKYEDGKYPNNSNVMIFEKRTFDSYRRHLIKQDLKQIKKEKIDFLFACLHIGGQYRATPSDYTINASQWFIDQGCDAVICNHEHVVHGTKSSKNGAIITYALGNCLGGSGVTGGPYGKRCEYSIAFHIHINDTNRKIEKYSFTVLKTVLSEDKYFETWPVYDLIQNETDAGLQNQLIEEALQVAFDFSGKRYATIESEFFL